MPIGSASASLLKGFLKTYIDQFWGKLAKKPAESCVLTKPIPNAKKILMILNV